MLYEGELKLRSHNTSHCLIEVVTKADLTVHVFLSQFVRYSEVCSGRVNTHIEVDNGEHESVISYVYSII